MSAASHDHVHIHFGARVFFVSEIEQRAVVHDAHAGSRHRVNQRRAFQNARRRQSLECQRQRNESSRDGCRACPPIRLNHVAIEPHRTLAQRLLVRHRAQRSPDQSLNFQGSAGLFSPRCLARRTFLGGARQHSVFAGNPAFAAPLQKTGHAVIDAGSADYPRVPQLDQHTSFGRGDKVRRDFQGTHLLRGPAVGSHSSSCSHQFLLRNSTACARVTPLRRSPNPVPTFHRRRGQFICSLASPVCPHLMALARIAQVELVWYLRQTFPSSPNAPQAFPLLVHESGFSAVAPAAHWLPEFARWNSPPTARLRFQKERKSPAPRKNPRSPFRPATDKTPAAKRPAAACATLCPRGPRAAYSKPASIAARDPSKGAARPLPAPAWNQSYPKPRRVSFSLEDHPD